MEPQSIALIEHCPGDNEWCKDMECPGPGPTKDSNPTLHQMLTVLLGRRIRPVTSPS